MPQLNHRGKNAIASRDAVTRPMREFFGFDAGVSYLLPRWIFLRLLGLVLVIAFYGWFDQGGALIGAGGLEPVSDVLAQRLQQFGWFEAFIRVPSLLWFVSGATSTPLTVVTVLGMATGMALLLNIYPRAALVCGWTLYVSIISVCGDFAPAQLDGLLLEALFLSIFFAPRGLRPGLGAASPPHAFAVFSMRWFVFRIMLQSGLTKLFGGDAKWFNFSVMEAMHETAPFPTVLGYYVFNLPHWCHVGEVLFTGVAELLAPLLALARGKPRLMAILLWVAFQLGIELTANFGWLNFMAIAAALLLLDDRMIQNLLVSLRATAAAAAVACRMSPATQNSAPGLDIVRVGVLYGLLSLHLFIGSVAFAIEVFDISPQEFSGAQYAPWRWAKYYRTANAYTLYAYTPTVRIHTEFLGSDDQGLTWKTYKMRYQPQDLNRRGAFIAPFFPRFEAALEIYGKRQKPARVIPAVGEALLKGNTKVLALFRENPFPGHPPQAIRFSRYQYTMTSLKELKASGNYWKREYLGELMSPLVYNAETGQFRMED